MNEARIIMSRQSSNDPKVDGRICMTISNGMNVILRVTLSPEEFANMLTTRTATATVIAAFPENIKEK